MPVCSCLGTTGRNACPTKCCALPFAVCSRWMIHRSERRLLFQSASSLPSRHCSGCTQSWQLWLPSFFALTRSPFTAGTFINNPFLTLVPIIIVSYALGAFVLGRPLRIPAAGIELLKDPHPLTGSYYHQLFRESWDIVWPFTIGSTILSVVCSLIAYPVTSAWLRSRQRAKTEN